MTKRIATQHGQSQQESIQKQKTNESPSTKRWPATHPLDLTFYRQSVRRFIFSNNIPLASLEPSEVVDLDLMHPQVGYTLQACTYTCRNGLLQVSSGQASAGSSRYVGGVNPFAVYEVDVRSIDFASSNPHHQSCEIILEFVHPTSGESLQVVAKHPAEKNFIGIRYRNDPYNDSYQSTLYEGPSLQAPYRLQVQLSGRTVNVFYSKDGEMRHLGRDTPPNNLASRLDLRQRATALASRFCIRTHLPKECTVTLGAVRSYLSAGIGQADIRLVTHADGAPCFSLTSSADASRLWFTFTIRGTGTGDGAQGVCSLDPSTGVPDLRFEGVIVLDHGDGLFRNSYACHLFYHDEDKVWRAYFSDFGGGKNREGRGETGLLVAESAKDPRRGFSVMKARELNHGITGHHEDPCGVWDAEAKRWRLLTTELSAGMRAKMWESKHWDGPWSTVGERAQRNCTGTLIQRVGRERFVFSGSSEGSIFVFRYPDLKELGTLEVDLPPFTKDKNSRVWPNVVPLPSGYPTRYIALMMDRANFPEVSGPTWSYGAMYLYWAHTDEISGEEYEFPTKT
jgi:hypothetical protein